MDFPGGSVVKNPPAKAGDMSSILGLERSPEERNVNPFHYLCLGNSHGQTILWATVHGVSKSGTQLSNGTTTKAVCMLIQSPIHPSPPSHLVTINFFSTSVTLFLFCNEVHLYQFFKIPHISDIIYLSIMPFAVTQIDLEIVILSKSDKKGNF